MSEIYIKLNKLYSKSGFMGKYGTDVWVSAIICLAFIIFINYYYFINIIEVVKADWPSQRCNPLVLPFAGFINKPTDMSNLEFTVGNFNNCLNTILQDVVLVALQPLYFAVNIIQEAINNLTEAFNKLRQMTAGLRKQILFTAEKIHVAMNNLVITFIGYTIKIKDSMLKVNGIITTAFYSLFASYMALTSLFLCVIDLIILILITIAIICLIYLLLSFLPIIGFIFKPFWMLVVIIMIIIMIPAIWFKIMLMRVLRLSTPPVPGIPGCFSAETPIEMVDSTNKQIKDVVVGDILKNGSTVTSVIQFSATEQNMYQLHGVRVTGEHRVFHPTLKWIKVKYHPESVYMRDYNELFVYCLNTNEKTFTIGKTLFSDWDDIDEEVWEDLQKYCVTPGYLPENFTKADIHTHLDSGFHGDSYVILANGLNIPVTQVKVNDILASGDKIVGVVKIDARDIDLYKFSFGDEGTTICGSRNIHIADKNLGIINCMSPHIKKERISGQMIEPFLYHFLTDTKCVMINNIRFKDYNSGIDMYLRQFNMV
jgi:hypothetical protein